MMLLSTHCLPRQPRAIEAYVGDIETMIGKTGRIAGTMTAAQLKPLVGKMTASELALARISPILKQVGDESVEEILQQVTDNELKGRFNAETGAKLDNKFGLDDFKEIVLLTTLATGLASGPRHCRLLTTPNARLPWPWPKARRNGTMP